MAIDNGPTIVDQFIKDGYVKTTMGGYILTGKGIKWLATTLQELYHLHNSNHVDISNGGSDEDRESGIQSEQE